MSFVMPTADFYNLLELYLAQTQLFKALILVQSICQPIIFLKKKKKNFFWSKDISFLG